MIIVRIVGGLGNQMFQYAYAKSLQQKGYKVRIDISKFKNYKLHGGYHLDKYNIDIETSSSFSNLITRLGFRRSAKEKSLLFDEKFLKLPEKEYVKGYFQTEKYFKEIKNIIYNQFQIKNTLSESTISYKKEIEKYKNACSIHVRRGDFISDKKANKVHGTCTLDYYEKAIEFLNSQFKEVHFFIFSDDILWAKKNLKIENVTFINHKTIPHEDLLLMSLCRFNITANSSFSWWGAWLNKHKSKVVIAPKQWFVDKENEVACNNWIQL
ncbi:MAG: alpha-1,2-fucosyltransferase [Polaribacter sp.]|uniref:alpha-1,2-fucosyltransferase n=1 Tax=Polaribacter sp. TaxID=1920175 RepID=UPI003BB03C7A